MMRSWVRLGKVPVLSVSGRLLKQVATTVQLRAASGSPVEFPIHPVLGLPAVWEAWVEDGWRFDVVLVNPRLPLAVAAAESTADTVSGSDCDAAAGDLSGTIPPGVWGSHQWVLGCRSRPPALLPAASSTLTDAATDSELDISAPAVGDRATAPPLLNWIAVSTTALDESGVVVGFYSGRQVYEVRGRRIREAFRAGQRPA